MGKCECSKEQMLMYAGAAGTAGYAAAQAFAPEKYEKFMYGKVEGSPPGTAGQKNLQWEALTTAYLTGFQIMTAQEKPSAKMMGMAGGMWAGAAVLTGVHAFKDKAMKPEVAIPSMIGQAAFGGLMVACAVKMKKDKDAKKL